jgi:uncharacterized protein YbaR (Trm112 family)
MFVELIDHLRCPRPHEETWLVASSTRTDSRTIMEGVLGCPICRAEYPVSNGIADFGQPPRPTTVLPPDEAEALRLAALLDLTDARGYVILVGELGAHARLVQRFSDVQLLLVNPPTGLQMGAGVSGLTTNDVLPLAAGSARAAALGDVATIDDLRSTVDSVRPGGRIVAPVALDVPADVAELARDERRWVGERAAVAAPTRPVVLRRGRD